MTRELILYAGLHKTASTSIQETMVRNQKRLVAQGFAYPVYKTEGFQPTGNHTRLLRGMFRRDPLRMGLAGGLPAATLEGWSARERDNAREGFAAVLRRAKQRVILAAEGLSTYSRDELEDVREWFDSGGFSVRVLCHVRHLSPWLGSMVAQRVRGQMRLTIAEAVEELRQAGGLVRPRMETLRSVFPQCEFVSHEVAAAHPHGPPGYFLETIGVHDTAAFQWQTANEGASDVAVRMLSVVNEKFGRTRWREEPEALLRFMAQPGLQAIHALAGPKFKLLESEAAPLAAFIAEENEWLLRQFGPAFHDPDPTFAKTPAQPSPEAARALDAAIALCEPSVRDHLAATRRKEDR